LFGAAGGVHAARVTRWPAVLLAVALVGLTAPAAQAQVRGQGTLLIKQSTDCSGNGESAQVYFPFSALFTGFEPNESGTVTAYTQPGGVQVGQWTVTVDALGNRCEMVVGTADPGQYKIVYDFGSGTGKQKVIRIIPAPPSPSPTPTSSESPNVSPSESPSESPSGTETPTGSESPSESPTESATVTGSPTDTGGIPTQTLGPGASTTPSPSTSVEGEKIELIPEADAVGDDAVLAHTGSDVSPLLEIGAGLLVAGAGLVVLARRRGRHA
jgi:hypothetical protein